MMLKSVTICAAAMISVVLVALIAPKPPVYAQTKPHQSAHAAPPVVFSRTATVDGVDLFYREAGPKDAPVVLLLHGFPTSSHMFRHLIPTLADRYHVIAPDFPGFGESASPDRSQFNYTFARYAELMDGLITQLGVKRYTAYSFDYGAPVSYRMALKHPERVSAFIVQNGNAYEEGIASKFWDPVKAYWASGAETDRNALSYLVALDTTRLQYVHGVKDISRLDPDGWLHDQFYLDRPGNSEIQLDIMYDYRTNLPLYPKFQAYFREHKPPMLIVWGKNDVIFPEVGASPYLRDLPNAELHLIDTGHFALEDKLDVIQPLIRDFLDRKVTRN